MCVIIMQPYFPLSPIATTTTTTIQRVSVYSHRSITDVLLYCPCDMTTLNDGRSLNTELSYSVFSVLYLTQPQREGLIKTGT
jgi:hypothetical protein